jgi:hypothetical protein
LMLMHRVRQGVALPCATNVVLPSKATPLTGLQVRVVRSLPNAEIKLRSRLSDIVDAAHQCWVCGWLLLLVRNRCAESIAKILPADYERVWIGIEPHEIHTFENGRTYREVSKDQRVLIQISFYLDPRTISQKFEYFLYLQQSEEHPMHLSDLLDRTHSLEWPTHKPYEGRIRPPEADQRLFKRWKDQCIELHNGVCSKTNIPAVSAIRLVDVTHRCFVYLPGDVSWVTLSYCWGGPQEHSLRNDNLADYRTPGALTEEILPPVIFDALIATEALGERYLWIDSLCIVQDDEVDKANYLSVLSSRSLMLPAVILHLVFPVSGNRFTAVLNNRLNSTVPGSLKHLIRDTAPTEAILTDASGALEAGRSRKGFSRGGALSSPRTRYTGNVKNHPGVKAASGNAPIICKSTATFSVATFSPPWSTP